VRRLKGRATYSAATQGVADEDRTVKGCGAMSRSGYYDDCESWSLICYRGQVASAIRGKRGQLFLLEMLAALDALPEKKLVASELEAQDGAVCAIGAVGRRRGVDMGKIDPEDSATVAGTFGIADQLAREIVYMNDEVYYSETDEERFARMRRWVVSNIHDFEPVHSGPIDNSKPE